MKPKLSGKNKRKAQELLFYVTDFLEAHNIEYHLEGGTLLGLVRDGQLLEWDYDLDLSICSSEVNRFKQVHKELNSQRYKIGFKNFATDHPPIKEGEPRIFKVKPRWISLAKEFLPFLRKHYICLDIFVKYPADDKTYWQAKRSIFSADRSHYEGYGEIPFMGKTLRTPRNAEAYLEKKYGDWKTPVKDWDCDKDELSKCKSLHS